MSEKPVPEHPEKNRARKNAFWRLFALASAVSIGLHLWGFRGKDLHESAGALERFLVFSPFIALGFSWFFFKGPGLPKPGRDPLAGKIEGFSLNSQPCSLLTWKEQAWVSLDDLARMALRARAFKTHFDSCPKGFTFRGDGNVWLSRRALIWATQESSSKLNPHDESVCLVAIRKVPWRDSPSGAGRL